MPEPVFEESWGGVMVTFLKDIYTEEYLRKLEINDRQIRAVLYIREHGKITNTDYQVLNETSHRTAARDLQELVGKDLITKLGTTGKGTYYVLKRQI